MKTTQQFDGDCRDCGHRIEIEVQRPQKWGSACVIRCRCGACDATNWLRPNGTDEPFDRTNPSWFVSKPTVRFGTRGGDVLTGVCSRGGEGS